VLSWVRPGSLGTLLGFFVAACSGDSTAVTEPQQTAGPVTVPPVGRHASPSPEVGCASTPVQTQHRQGGMPGLDAVPWIQAEPALDGVIAYLFSGNRPLHTGGKFPDGATTKVLWIVENAAVGPNLDIDGRNLTGPGTLHLSYPHWGSHAPGDADQFPTILNMSAPGCWQVELASGSVRARVTLLVVG